MLSLDGKMRETDCANIETFYVLSNLSRFPTISALVKTG
jgi:hypothetical protein